MSERFRYRLRLVMRTCAPSLRTDSLNQNRDVLDVLSIPGLEGLEKLKTVGGRGNGNGDGGTVRRGSLVGVLARIICLNVRF